MRTQRHALFRRLTRNLVRLAGNFVNYSRFFRVGYVFTFARDFREAKGGKEKETPGRRAAIYRRIICVYMCSGAFSSLMKIYYVISSPALLFDVAG